MGDEGLDGKYRRSSRISAKLTLSELEGESATLAESEIHSHRFDDAGSDRTRTSSSSGLSSEFAKTLYASKAVPKFHDSRTKAAPVISELEMRVKRVSAQSPKYPAKSVLYNGKQSSWRTQSGTNHTIVFELTTPALIGYLDIHNNSTSKIEISLSLKDRDKDYVVASPERQLPHSKLTRVKCGFLPSLYIRIRCVKGCPCSLYRVKALGMPFDTVREDLGHDLHQILVNNTVQGFFNPVVPVGSDTMKYCTSAYARGFGTEHERKFPKITKGCKRVFGDRRNASSFRFDEMFVRDSED